jgi:hypothetical protein
MFLYLLLGETVWQHVRDGAYPACGGGQPLQQPLTKEFKTHFIIFYFYIFFAIFYWE